MKQDSAGALPFAGAWETAPLQYRKHLSLGLKPPEPAAPPPPSPIQAIGRRKGTSTMGLNSESQRSLPGQVGCRWP